MKKKPVYNSKNIEKIAKLEKITKDFEPRQCCGIIITDENDDEIEQLNDYGSFCEECIEKVCKKIQEEEELNRGEKIDYHIYDMNEDDEPVICGGSHDGGCGHLLWSDIVGGRQEIEHFLENGVDDIQDAYVLLHMIENKDISNDILSRIKLNL
jgi:hypothetical protein